ncbi:hypothetical protein SAMN05519104_6651 [Rhizobiales bacterium GAS188]|nr:hypothetical protein SAMN05519104_6651 [Rhizobiales bacterium GAS188]
MNGKSSVDWRAINLRLSVFPTAVKTVEIDDWRAITGTAEPQTRVHQTAMVNMLGPFLGGQLQVSSIPGRIDIVLMPRPAANDAPQMTGLDTTIFIGDFFETLRGFQGATRAWLEGISFDVLRLAFGAVILSPSEDAQASYILMESLLKSVRIVPGKMKDMSFTVNWPVPSTILEDASLNRVTKWATLSLRGRLGAVAAPGAPAVASEISIAEGPALELDHSTPAERSTPIPHEKLIPIYDELLKLAVENAQRGEVPCL